MKNLWDEINPDLAFFSAKTLRDQASRVDKNWIAMETEYWTDKNQSNSNNVNSDSTEENPNGKSENLSKNNTLIISDTEIQSLENPVPEANTSINETIKDIFMQNITSINSINSNEWNYNTWVNKTPSPDILTTIDDLALQYLLEVQAREKWPPSLIDLNNYIYSAAVSVNQYLGQLIENKERNTKKQRKLPIHQ